MPDFATIQASSADLYARYPRLVTIAFIVVVAIGSVLLFHLLFLAQPRKGKEPVPVPLPLNIQGNRIERLEVHIYQNGQMVPTLPPAAPSVPLTSLQLIQNGGFEEGTVGWGTGFFASYFGSPGGAALMFNNAVARWYVDDQKTHSGVRALRIEQSSSYVPDKFSSFSQRIKVAPAQRYEVKYWAYLEATDGRGSFSLRVLPSRRTEPREWDGSRKKIDPTRLDQWQEVRLEFDSGSDTFFDLRFSAETAMKLWVDDVSVTPVGIGN